MSASTGMVRIRMQAVLRRLQLASGLVMLTYLFLHLVNHALGTWSLDFAGRGLVLALRLWRSTPGTIALYGAASLYFLRWRCTRCTGGITERCRLPNGSASGPGLACQCC